MSILKGKTVLLTGSTGSIGKEIAKKLSISGAKIALSATNIDKLKSLKADLGNDHLIYPCDLSDLNNINKLSEDVIGDFGTIDILINNAGIRHVKKLLDHTKQDWDDMISVNLTAPFLASQAVIPHMIKNGKGKIINFGSIASFMGRPDRVGYVAAKSGVLGLTRALSVDLTGKNINVNTICPGLISTPFNQKYAEDPKHGEAWGKETVVGRWGQPKDIVGAAVFLSSDESDFINGSEIKIDGGWLSSKVRRGELDNE